MNSNAPDERITFPEPAALPPIPANALLYGVYSEGSKGKWCHAVLAKSAAEAGRRLECSTTHLKNYGFSGLPDFATWKSYLACLSYPEPIRIKEHEPRNPRPVYFGEATGHGLDGLLAVHAFGYRWFSCPRQNQDPAAMAGLYPPEQSRWTRWNFSSNSTMIGDGLTPGGVPIYTDWFSFTPDFSSPEWVAVWLPMAVAHMQKQADGIVLKPTVSWLPRVRSTPPPCSCAPSAKRHGLPWDAISPAIPR